MNNLIELIKRGYRIEFSTDLDGLISVSIKNHSFLIKPTANTKEMKRIIKDILKGYTK